MLCETKIKNKIIWGSLIYGSGHTKLGQKVLHDKTKLKHIIFYFFAFPDSTISVVCC